MVIGGPAGPRDAANAHEPPTGEMTDQAHRLRDRPGDRADPAHPGRLGRRHRRLPRARAGARRGGDAGRRRLRARRRHLPAADRPPALGGLDARRARDPPRERAPAAAQLLRPDVPETLVAAVLRSLEGDPAPRYSSARELARALERRPSRRASLRRRPTRLPTNMIARPAAPRAATGGWTADPATPGLAVEPVPRRRARPAPAARPRRAAAPPRRDAPRKSAAGGSCGRSASWS